MKRNEDNQMIKAYARSLLKENFFYKNDPRAPKNAWFPKEDISDQVLNMPIRDILEELNEPETKALYNELSAYLSKFSNFLISSDNDASGRREEHSMDEIRPN